MAFLILDQIFATLQLLLPQPLLRGQSSFFRAPVSAHQWEKAPRFAPCQAPLLPDGCSQAPFGKGRRPGWFFCMSFECSVDAGGLEEPDKEVRLHPCWASLRLVGCTHTLHHPSR